MAVLLKNNFKYTPEKREYAAPIPEHMNTCTPEHYKHENHPHPNRQNNLSRHKKHLRRLSEAH
jgi:hypothetical protein